MAKKRHHHGDMGYSDREERAQHRQAEYRGDALSKADPRRMHAMRDAGMIQEDHHAMANLPQHMMIKDWPSIRGYNPQDMIKDSDNIKGVDRQMDEDNSEKMRNMKPHKV